MLAFAGCTSNLYRAGALPEELAAPPVESVQRLDLTELLQEARPSDVIGAGDVLEVAISTDYETEVNPRQVRVAEDGAADIPLVGPVAVAGMTLEQAERTIAAAGVQRQLFRQPSVHLKVAEQGTNQVTVMGAVKEPKTYRIPRGSSHLLTALVMAGGLAHDAGPDVEIRRPGRPAGSVLPQGGDRPPLTARAPGELTAYEQPVSTAPESVHVNLISAVRDGGADHRLADGDVVMVAKRQKPVVYVDGLVKKPGEYEIPEDRELRVLDALALAGGRETAIAGKVWVVRSVPGQSEPVVIRVRVAEAKRDGKANLPLAPGDIVSVEETPTTFVYSLLKGFFRLGSNIPMG